MDITNPYKWKGVWIWVIMLGICFLAGFAFGMNWL